ncbi:hypothetical protein QYE76_009002 [Lolium multiflorum]|uniref:Pentatricopeptide repeat-containing protein n=1 Tax=Lolium multiflorum TaxID=4521 RepID=A0AAD8TR47_LOLMU|nr:hypothetical protein QYE76_009002 [Lolium multiflorum]
MSRLYSIAPAAIFLRRSSSTSPPSLRAPGVVLDAATERVRSGTFSPEDARDLFDELLLQATPVPGHALNGFLAALARTTCSDGLSLAVALFSRMSRGHGPPVASPTVHTYGILLGFCCRARQPDLALAFFSRFLRAGLNANCLIVNTLLKALCQAKRTDEAADVLLHRMPHLGCEPDAISYNTVIKGLCDGSRSNRALELLRMMAKQEAGCSPDVVSYTTVIHGFLKEGEKPNVITFNSLIDGYCLVGKMQKASRVHDDMVSVGIEPGAITYGTLIDGYFKAGMVDAALTLFQEMSAC